MYAEYFKDGRKEEIAAGLEQSVVETMLVN